MNIPTNTYALRAENERLRAALKQIAEWKSHSKEYAFDYGSNGLREFYRAIAERALDD